MNTKTIVWVVVAIAVLVGVWYLLSTPSGVTNSLPPVATTTQMRQSAAVPAKSPATSAPKPVLTKTTANMVGVGSLKYLLDLKQALVCSVKTTSGSARSGTLYVANGKARADLATASMIDDGTYLYVWANGATTGLKFTNAPGVNGYAVANSGGINPVIENLSYACNPWATDTSVFTPPASVSF